MTIQEYIDQINATHPKLNLRTERYGCEVTSPNPAWGTKYRVKMFRTLVLKDTGYYERVGGTSLGDLDLNEATKKTIDKWVKALLRQRADIAKANAAHDAQVAAYEQRKMVLQTAWIKQVRSAMGYPEGTPVPKDAIAPGYNKKFIEARTDNGLVITLPEDLDKKAALLADLNALLIKHS
jgi:hypothetical protein